MSPRYTPWLVRSCRAPAARLRAAVASIGVCASVLAALLSPLGSVPSALAAPPAILHRAPLGPRDLVLTPTHLGANWATAVDNDSSDGTAYTVIYVNDAEERALVLQVGLADDPLRAEGFLHLVAASYAPALEGDGIRPMSVEGLGDSRVFHGTVHAPFRVEDEELAGSVYVFRVETTVLTVVAIGVPGTEMELDEQGLAYARLQQERVRSLFAAAA